MKPEDLQKLVTKVMPFGKHKGRLDLIDGKAARQYMSGAQFLGSTRTHEVSRVTRTAFLAPAIVEAIMDGRHPAHLTMKDLLEPFPAEWGEQHKRFLVPPPVQSS